MADEEMNRMSNRRSELNVGAMGCSEHAGLCGDGMQPWRWGRKGVEGTLEEGATSTCPYTAST
jgi:hypothetical protein